MKIVGITFFFAQKDGGGGGYKKNSSLKPDCIAGILGSIYNYLVDKVVRTYSIINGYVLTFKVK